MKTYIGTKIVKMKPMTRGEWCEYRGVTWALPSDECGDDAGYLVEYTDGGKPNFAGHDGYISWSPKEQAEAAYRETVGLTFGLAIEAMKKGVRVARAGWNGKGMWMQLVKAESWFMSSDAISNESPVTRAPWIGMRTADNKFVPWLASQTDMLAEDWQIV